MIQPPNTCRICWAAVRFDGLHDEEVAAIEEAGADYVCKECLDEDEIGDDWSEHSTYHVRNGSVVG